MFPFCTARRLAEDEFSGYRRTTKPENTLGFKFGKKTYFSMNSKVRYNPGGEREKNIYTSTTGTKEQVHTEIARATSLVI